MRLVILGGGLIEVGVKGCEVCWRSLLLLDYLLGVWGWTDDVN